MVCGSNPAKVDGFLERKSSGHKSFRRDDPKSDILDSIKNIKPEKIGSEQNLIGLLFSSNTLFPN